jgi:hypothetical protein
MSTDTQTRGTSKAMLWTGRVITTLISLFMLMGGVMNLLKPAFVVEGTIKAGYPESAIVPIGLACTVSAILYAIAQTTVLGAILLTGYFGGAVATHVRLSESTWFVAAIFGVMTWLGVFFRDSRLRKLVPLRQLPE